MSNKPPTVVETDQQRAGRLLILILCLSVTTIGALLFTLLLVFI